jgi:hypothetical protein
MTHLDFPACHESPIGDALRRIRLRHERSRWVGDRWVHVSVKRRAQSHARMIAGTKRRSDYPKRWQPPEGREQPREEFMDWRRSSVRYKHPGCMRFLHGRGPPMVGTRLLYVPAAREASAEHLSPRQVSQPIRDESK